MRRLTVLLPTLLLALCVCACALAETVPSAVYRARLAKETRLRSQPDSTAGTLATIGKGKSVEVLVWNEDWCLCDWNGQTGYLPTSRLYEYWRLGDAPLPQFEPMTGYATVTEPCFARTEPYSGNTFEKGFVVAVLDDTGAMPMRRNDTHLPEGCFTFTPFADPSSPDLRPGDVLYAYTTFYNDRVGAPKAKERRHNIELSVERVTGRILAPGESLSFNAVCGPYRRGNGYVNAPNISLDGYGVGGGVCQVSTTIFNAVLGIPLQLDDWEVHQVSGVKYVPVNYDACVSSSQDFAFTNNLPYPLMLTVLTQNGALTAIFSVAE